jgi:polyphosphate kinase
VWVVEKSSVGVDMAEESPGKSALANRELSWLNFNARVLDQARDETVPLLERLKFAAIFSNNLDEFFMVRVAGLRQQSESGYERRDPAGLTPDEQLRMIREKVRRLIWRQSRCVREVLAGLETHGIRLASVRDLEPSEKQELRERFEHQVLPALTPIAVDSSHPFPMLPNGSVEVAVRLRRPDVDWAGKAIVEVPKVLPRFLDVRGPADESQSHRSFVLIEEVIAENLESLFEGCEICGALVFRVTRDMDFEADEERVADLLGHIQEQLRKRQRRSPVRLEVPVRADPELLAWLTERLELPEDAVYTYSVPLNLASFFRFIDLVRTPELLEPPLPPLDVPQIRAGESVFNAIRREGVIPMFHPFQSFEPVVQFLEEAAEDPDVLAIKQTLYRVSGDSPVVRALQRAAENGKQVTVIVEIRARFDEEQNITWARHLEESGAHVIYGIVGLKIHCKALLVVRREEGRIVRYLHLATGNYNDKTAQIYTDIGMFLTDPETCMDVASLFNVVTGYSKPPRWRKISVAPFDLRKRFIALIERETERSTPAAPGHIIAKMNSLVDPVVIRKLYAAADAGVRVELIVRGICCLRPGGTRGEIEVVSIVDRFLEHSRIYYFRNGGNPEYYLASADWMPRNLDRRVEVLFPVEDEFTQDLLMQILHLQLGDRRKGRRLKADDVYHRQAHAPEQTRSQVRTYELFQRLSDRSSRERRETQSSSLTVVHSRDDES